MKNRSNPPHPFALIEAMRSIGYTPPTALADLIDNSLTARSTEIRIRVAPLDGSRAGSVTVEDNGEGMTPARHQEAMRWGGEGPRVARSKHDLGRFGLGLKTASFSLGKSLTVATRAKPGAALSVLRWDLEHVIDHGWEMVEDLPAEAEQELARTALRSDPSRTGTAVIITDLDRLEIGAALISQKEKNFTALLKKISGHLGLVFHRYISNGTKIYLGSSQIAAWDLFAGGTMRDSEQLSDGIHVSSFVLPHHSKVTPDEYDRLAGPAGWTAHQGFLVYRADRLIVSGGWLRLFQPEESCKLARIKIDIPNSADAGWKLNVMKSTLVPPSTQLGALERIGEATRRMAMSIYNFRGDRQAPQAALGAGDANQPFWNQETGKETVRFRINRSHPVVQTLKQSVKDSATAEHFLRTFERLLPFEAILQDPKRTTNGALPSSSPEEINQMGILAKKAIRVLRNQGHGKEEAERIVLSVEPFSWHAPEIRTQIDE